VGARTSPSRSFLDEVPCVRMQEYLRGSGAASNGLLDETEIQSQHESIITVVPAKGFFRSFFTRK
jgi:hypothetical protein